MADGHRDVVVHRLAQLQRVANSLSAGPDRDKVTDCVGGFDSGHR